MANPALTTCVITGYLYNYLNQAQSAVELVFTVPSRQPDSPQSDQNVFLIQSEVSVYTNAQGKFTVTLPRGVWFHVVCDSIGLDHDYYVPDNETADFNEVTGFYRREKYRMSDGDMRPPEDSFSEDGGI